MRVSGFADYERHFGGLDPRTLLGHSLRHFFDNGGHDACVLRLASTTSAEAEDNVATATAHAGGLAVAASSPGAWANGVRLRISGHGAVNAWVGMRRPTSVSAPPPISLTWPLVSIWWTLVSAPRRRAHSSIQRMTRKVLPVPLMK